MGLFESNCIDALLVTVEPTSDFQDTAMFGGYYKSGRDDVANGQMSSACCAEQ